MSTRFLLTAVSLALGLVALSFSQGATAGKTKEATPTPTLGKILYDNHCAFCHGADAKGGGPYSVYLKVWPPDLTVLAKKNKGVYPEMHVAEAIDGEFQTAAHGSREMPIWGPTFRSMAHGKQDSAQVRIKSLVRYLESAQEK